MEHQQPQMSVPRVNITTKEIQKYLEENKDLILTILENRNRGRFAECAPYQAKLQQNLIYLAELADLDQAIQMQAQTTLQLDEYPQTSQFAMPQRQLASFGSNFPPECNDQQQQLSLFDRQQQFIQEQMGVRFVAQPTPFEGEQFLNTQRGEHEGAHRGAHG